MIKVHLSKLLGEQKMKVSDLSKATGLHRNGLMKLYKEETDGIKFETLEKVCKSLNCEISDLLEIIEEPEKEEPQKPLQPSPIKEGWSGYIKAIAKEGIYVHQSTN